MVFEKLNEEQRFAARCDDRNLLVLAGAGTGKTRTIIGRALYLLDKGVDPSRIKILSFTRKAANEIVERIKAESAGNGKARQLYGSTFHSWCMELLHKYFSSQNFNCIDEDDRISAFKLAMGRLHDKKSVRLMNNVIIKPETVSKIFSFSVNVQCSLSEAISRVMNISLNNEAGKEAVADIRMVCEPVIKEYIAYKQKHQYIDYDDMLLTVAITMERNDALRKAIVATYDHILVDEVQDTNPLQWRLLKSFFKDCNVFCVGDDAQSIYGFRGADFKSVHSFTELVPDSRVARLDENFRSTQEILDLSNWMLNKSPLCYGKFLRAHRGHGEKPNLYLLGSDWEEANAVTDRILQGIEEGRKYKDFLVMARGFHSLRRIEAVCISKGIPYVAVGGTALMRSAHVRDLAAALRVVANYHDDLAWIRYLELWPGIGEKKAAKIIEEVFVQPSIEGAIALVNKRYGEELPEMGNNLSLVSGLTNQPAKAIELLAEKMETVLSKRYQEDWDTRKSDFVALKAVAEKCPTIQAFIEMYILDPSAELTMKDPKKGDDDVVILSTIHSAKGLEADVCFIANVTPSGYPSPKAVSPDEIEEERRCLYVALTRARDELNIMSRVDSVTAVPAMPDSNPDLAMDRAYFLNGIPEGMVNMKGRSTGCEFKEVVAKPALGTMFPFNPLNDLDLS